MNTGFCRGRGFTLVEVVVALTLVSVIMLGLVTALGTFANTGSRLEHRALESDNVRLVSAFLQQSLAEASPRDYAREGDSAYTVWFAGEDEQIEWLGLMPARHATGGLYHFRLTFEPDADGGRLFLRYLPYIGDDAAQEWGHAPEHLLLAEVDRFGASYQRLGSPEWLPRWRDPEVLPARVRIRVALNGSEWPDLIVRVTAAESGLEIDGTRFDGEDGT